MISPHAANATKESDVTVSDWPVVTKSALADLAKMEALPEGEVNQKVLAFIRARKAINDAMIACRAAKRFYSPGEPACDKLSDHVTELKKLHDDFPITILENAQGRPRRHIMAGHDTVDRPTPWGVE